MANFDLRQGDANTLIKTVESASVDLIVFDPAYESLEKHRAKGTTTRLSQSSASSNTWFPVVSNEYLEEHLNECFRILKPGSHAYMLCDQETAFALQPKAIEAGFKFWKCIIWDKVSIGMGYHYRCQHEVIMFLEKVERPGKHRQLNNASISDIIRVKGLRGNELYPTEKPVELLNILIQQSSNEGDIVFDGFFGSGASAEAALKNNRHFVGFDLLSKALEKASERCANFGTSEKVMIQRAQPLLFA